MITKLLFEAINDGRAKRYVLSTHGEDVAVITTTPMMIDDLVRLLNEADPLAEIKKRPDP